MISRMFSLQKRRLLLVARSERERAELAAQVSLLAPRLRTVDRIVSVVREHPLAASAGGLAFLFAGARTVLRWGMHAAPLYSLFRLARRHLKDES